MADENVGGVGSGQAPFLDLDSFIKRPRGFVKVGGRKHAVFHPSDLPYGQYLKLVSKSAQFEEYPRHLVPSWLVDRAFRYCPTFSRLIAGFFRRRRRSEEEKGLWQLACEICKLIPSLSASEIVRLPMSEIGVLFLWVQKLIAEDAAEATGTTITEKGETPAPFVDGPNASN